MRKSGSALENLALVSYIGIAMMVPILAGVVGGRWIDERLGTRPVFLFVLIFVGIMVGFRNVFAVTTRNLPPRKRR
ncbi:AtpZ/AtpI family protein [Tindallia californiensis]|uniref:Putative F0F1-ATPase subunit Ca2+/Mg2+ transporter n=1 Tax=Tindallia californiensis TaxID=159292 RepID=A0A1H3LH29_9FIRM|nr:AtpZ/AtpI family protein [Tindallia californiensis]SDY63469.1 Putative F0F1-ATPase subunit Ca2+/Mg2+ transporter [Tindallia californiensis]